MIDRIRHSALLVLLCLVSALNAEPYPAGSSKRSVNINGEAIELFAYKPAHYSGGPVLLVLHGLGTPAPGYRDYAVPLADQLGWLVIAPRFDRKIRSGDSKAIPVPGRPEFFLKIDELDADQKYAH